MRRRATSRKTLRNLCIHYRRLRSHGQRGNNNNNFPLVINKRCERQAHIGVNHKTAQFCHPHFRSFVFQQSSYVQYAQLKLNSTLNANWSKAKRRSNLRAWHLATKMFIIIIITIIISILLRLEETKFWKKKERKDKKKWSTASRRETPPGPLEYKKMMRREQVNRLKVLIHIRTLLGQSGLFYFIFPSFSSNNSFVYCKLEPRHFFLSFFVQYFSRVALHLGPGGDLKRIRWNERTRQQLSLSSLSGIKSVFRLSSERAKKGRKPEPTI